jgi:ribose transport system substrate-binding protein
MSVSRRNLLKQGGALGAAAAALGVPASALAAPGRTTSYPIRSQEGNKKVIFVTHDDNPFFVPCRKGFEEFGSLAGWDTQWTGATPHDDAKTVENQLAAIAANPMALGLTRTNTEMFDDIIKQAQEKGIFVILYNTASDGYQDLGLAYVGQEFIPAGIKSGLQAGKYAQEISGKTEGVIVLGTIAPGHSALDARMEGARQGIAQYNEENGTNFTTEDLTTSTDQATAIGAIQAKVTELGDRLVGMAHADYVHWFAGIFLEEQGMAGKVANGGFDLLPGVIDVMKNGSAQWSIGQNPYAQGWITSALIHMKTSAGFEPFSYDTGAEVVDASNIDFIAEREAKFAT